MAEGGFTRLPPRRAPIPTRPPAPSPAEPEATERPADSPPQAEAPRRPWLQPALALAREEFLAQARSPSTAVLAGGFFLLVAAGRILGLGALLGAPGSVPPGSGLEEARAAAVTLAFLAPPLVLMAAVGPRAAAAPTDLSPRAAANARNLGLAGRAALAGTVGVAAGMLLPLGAWLGLNEALLMGGYAGMLAATWTALARLFLAASRSREGALLGVALAWLLFFALWGFPQRLFAAAGIAALGTALNPCLLFLGAVQQGVADTATLARLTPGLPPVWAFRILLLWALLVGAAAGELERRRARET